MKKPKPLAWCGQPVRILWEDAWVDNALGFITPEDAATQEALPVCSVGILMSSTPKGVVICRERSQNENNRGMQFIPRSCIKSLKALK